MRWLVIDTSGGTAVGVVEVGGDGSARVVAQVVRDDARGHVESLAPGIETVLGESGTAVRDLAALAVGTGPAPFTGLRVGLATATAFARAAELPLHGVCSVEAVAWGAEPGVVLVATDARRREVYWAGYDTRRACTEVAWERHEPAVGPAADAVAWATTLDEPVRVRGRGAALFPELAAIGETEDGAVVRLDGLAALAAARVAAGAPTPLTPRYLRRPDVHVAGPRKRAS
jgi:tRNA threonylcarbamoyladenosine biosynthesis protein TsaB